MQNKKQTSELNATKKLTYLASLSIVLSLAASASAFQSTRESQVSLAAAKKHVLASTGMRTRSRTVLSHRRDPSMSSRLHYRDGTDESDEASRFGWLNTIFASSQQADDSEQQFVDEYLEFLDRRYRRLHNEEGEENPKPFSALSWLKQGSPSRNDAMVTPQQQEDALFVLGVAGLASRKLLQKHHLHMDADSAVVASHVSTMEVLDADISPSGPFRVLIKSVLVPMMRVLYIAQRQKDIFLRNQMRQMRKFVAGALRITGKTVTEGPLNAARAVIEIGGGKKTIAMTFTTLATMLILLRPVLRAVMTEGAVRP